MKPGLAVGGGLAACAGSVAEGVMPPRAEAQEAPPRPRGVARVAFLEGGNVGSHPWQATRDGLREQ